MSHRSLHMITDDFEAASGSSSDVDPFPEPHSREYILRKSTRRPFPYSVRRVVYEEEDSEDFYQWSINAGWFVLLQNF